jgi:hypothetical protein
MDELTPEPLAAAYVACTETGDRTMVQWFPNDFVEPCEWPPRPGDLGRRGGMGPGVLRGPTHRAACSHEWRRSCHGLGDGVRARHVGNGFPRMAGLPVRGNRVTWSQVHVFGSPMGG